MEGNVKYISLHILFDFMVAEVLTNNKRIAKNTLLLYLRMLLMMGIALYTSRVILQVLGIVDFGIYNVVGGVVALLGFINTSLSGASSRFLAFVLAKGNKSEIQNELNCIRAIHYLVSGIVFILAETIGLWFVTNKLVVPEVRVTAALWVYQCSVFSCIIMLTSLPYNALIIARERMSAFAYMSIIEASLKLIIVYCLFIVPYDKLIVYSILMVVILAIIRVMYAIYCRKHFEENFNQLSWNWNRFKEIFSYLGWVLYGNLSIIGYTQGLNILLNLFFGPIVNAARGIAVQIQNACNQFFMSFQMAVNPQITKSFACGNLRNMHNLILSSSRLSFYLMLLISLPILYQTEFILHLWLVNVPNHTANFVRIILLISLNYTLSGPTVIAIQATGRIKRFQIIEASLLLLIVPICYFFLVFFKISPEQVFITYFVIDIVTQFVRVSIVYPQIKLPIKSYFVEILWPITKVCGLVWIIPTLACKMMRGSEQSIFSFSLITLSCLFSVVIIVLMVGIRKDEKMYIKKKLSVLKISGR